MLADLAMIDRRLERLQAGGGRHGTPAEREANEREEVILVRLKAVLEGGRPIRDEPLDPDDEKAHPRLPVPDPEAGARAAQRRRGRPRGRPGRWSSAIGGGLRPPARAGRRAVGARSRWSWASSTPTRRRCSWRSWASPSRSLDRVIALSYRLVGLISFLTAGPDEVRAWPIPDGSNAVDAAGAIHTDLAKGFIRAETIGYEELLARGLDRRGEAATARCARRARPTASATGTSSRSCSAGRTGARRMRARRRPTPAGATPSVEAAVAALQVGQDRDVVGVRLGGLEVGEEVLLLVPRDVDRGGQPVVGDRDELVVALELVGDRLDQRLVLVGVEDPAADRLDERRRTPRAPSRPRGRAAGRRRRRCRPRAARRSA